MSSGGCTGVAEGAVEVVCDDALGAGQPATGMRHLALHHQAERHPECTLRRVRPRTPSQVPLVRVLPRRDCAVVVADQIGGDRQPLEVRGRKILARRREQQTVGLAPSPSCDGVSDHRRCAGHANQVRTTDTSRSLPLGERRENFVRMSSLPRASVETMGLEPTTPCLQSRCSSQLSYVPATARG